SPGPSVNTPLGNHNQDRRGRPQHAPSGLRVRPGRPPSPDLQLESCALHRPKTPRNSGSNMILPVVAQPEHDGKVCMTQPTRGLDDGAEHRLEFEARAADVARIEKMPASAFASAAPNSRIFLSKATLSRLTPSITWNPNLLSAAAISAAS